MTPQEIVAVIESLPAGCYGRAQIHAYAEVVLERRLDRPALDVLLRVLAVWPTRPAAA